MLWTQTNKLNEYFLLIAIKCCLVTFAHPPAAAVDGTVHNVKRHRPPSLQPMLSPCALCTVCEGRLPNPLYEPGCWGIHEAVGTWAWFHQEITAGFMSFISLSRDTKDAEVESAWERTVRRFFLFFDGWEKQQRQGEEVTAGWQVPSPGSVQRDAARPKNNVRSSNPGGGYVKTHLQLYVPRETFAIATNILRLFPFYSKKAGRQLPRSTGTC